MDELFNSISACSIGGDVRTDAVVLQRFGRIQFHKRNVFVGSGMEQDLGPMLLQHVAEPTSISDIPDNRAYMKRKPSVFEFFMNVIQTVFVTLIEQEGPRFQQTDLTS